MNKTVKITIITSIVVLTIIIINIYLGIYEGISLKGRKPERLLIIVYFISIIIGIYKSIKLKKSIQIFSRLVILPISLCIIYLLISPVGFINFSIMTLNNMFEEQQIYFENEDYKLIKSHSVSTDNAYEIINKYLIFDKTEKHFQSALNLDSCEIKYADHVFSFNNKVDETLRIRINKN